VRRLSTALRRVLSGRILEELGLLQGRLGMCCTLRSAALRRLFASRQAATPLSQREFWEEYCHLDREYRAAVRRLAQFCREQGGLAGAAVSAARYREGRPSRSRRGASSAGGTGVVGATQAADRALIET
jgi:hypothetical protein